MKLPPLAAIRAFEAAARLESFARAAEELGTTSAAISQHVRALEDWLGQPLFARKARGVTLTKAGRAFGTEVSAGLGMIATAAERLRKPARSHHVSLSCLPSVVNHWLGERLPDFQKRHPDLQVSISYSADAQSAEQAGTDLLICHGRQPSPDAVLLISGETRPAASPEFIAAHGPFDQPRDLLTAPLLHDKSPASWSRWFRKVGVEASPQQGPMFADFNLLRSSLLAGLGVGLCPLALIRRDIEDGRLILLFDEGSDQDQGYWLVERSNPSPEAQLMRDWLVAEAMISKEGQA
ncbi:LysR substrate-binding domain-containing protein [Rhizobium paknamense]|uniref:LysR family glycine cleavage system transcriptional activator n=1 Tax=Rhizobium paknamense TaxID=1206817 RepID=A0ABU0IJ79_9HYPH|nr:LysR substrate-binding domain-containing protein [Rhizobium paknamense]MDQ0457269.1 LysR family glycine cleavage system transcriptional activator [Rhizobium paknamense]